MSTFRNVISGLIFMLISLILLNCDDTASSLGNTIDIEIGEWSGSGSTYSITFNISSNRKKLTSPGPDPTNETGKLPSMHFSFGSSYNFYFYDDFTIKNDGFTINGSSGSIKGNFISIDSCYGTYDFTEVGSGEWHASPGY